MAYGTPDTLDQVEAYYTHIRGGRTPSPASVAELRARYERIGGRTPLLDITRDTASRLERELTDLTGSPHRVYLGMKHWHPYIEEAVRAMAADGVARATAIVLAPHYSRMSVGGYAKAIDLALASLDDAMDVRVVERWHDRPEFVEMMAELVRRGLERFPPDVRDRVVTIFTAHSLPVRIRDWNDPYESELLASSAAVARAAGITEWRFAWQSAGQTQEPWLGPDILEYLGTLRREGVRHVLQVPIGFVAEHLEILWDIDREARSRAEELGMVHHRTELPNASDALVHTLAAAILAAEGVAA